MCRRGQGFLHELCHCSVTLINSVLTSLLSGSTGLRLGELLNQSLVFYRHSSQRKCEYLNKWLVWNIFYFTLEHWRLSNMFVYNSVTSCFCFAAAPATSSGWRHYSVCPILVNTISQERQRGIFSKFGTNVQSDAKMSRFDFGGWRSKFKDIVRSLCKRELKLKMCFKDSITNLCISPIWIQIQIETRIWVKQKIYIKDPEKLNQDIN